MFSSRLNASHALLLLSSMVLASCSRPTLGGSKSAPPLDPVHRASTQTQPDTTSTTQTPPLELPRPASPKTARWLEQGWDESVRARVHHGSQGSATFPVPYEWFVALEQPSSTPERESPLLIDPAYMGSLGFINVNEDSERNPDGLPIGFARVDPFHSPLPGSLNPNPATGGGYTGIGFTCAACHTAQLEYGDTRLLIDGGPASTNLGAFREALQGALQGLADSARAQRFATRVLSSNATPEQRQMLQAQLLGFTRAAAQELAATVAATRARLAQGEVLVDEGFARLDALARIGNQVFWNDQRRSSNIVSNELDDNYALPNAPVSFPAIWDAPWFDWVQYNGSIMQPMFRNFSEALGVGAQINLGADPSLQLRSTVDVRSLHQLERDIAGAPPWPAKAFQGLRSPRWPEDVLGQIDRKLAERGAALYAERCESCHLPPPSTRAFWSSKHWRTDGDGHRPAHRYLVLELVPIDQIGTDPAQADNLRKRMIQLPGVLGGKSVSYGQALTRLTKAIDKAYDEAKVPRAERAAFSGGRENRVRAELAYRPRPLNGAWATPPFLHNGSVPTLYQLLSPIEERDTTFYVGSRAFDPTVIGFEHGPAPGLSMVDTSIPGNLNTGHEFTDRAGRGVLGPALSKADRMALIEFIKTL